MYIRTFPIIKTEAAAREIFANDPSYILGVGGCQIRYHLTLKMNELGGQLTSAIADTANIGKFNVELGSGINVMHGVLISNDVKIGEGTLLNANSLIHHDVSVGHFCEISPGSILTGRVQVGNYTTIGSGAVILPKVNIGSNVIIGAGAVVTKDVKDQSIAIGVPARIKQANSYQELRS